MTETLVQHECYNCAQQIADLAEAVEYAEGQHYCRDCYTDLFAECDQCGEVVEQDEATWFEDEVYCERCRERRLFECHDCGELGNSSTHYISEIIEGRYCESCYDERFTYCCECDTEILREDREMCGQCAEELDNGKDIKPYGYTPELNFYGNHDRFWMGVELETEGNPRELGEAIASVTDIDKIYQTEDCTVDGPEITSHPATLEYHREGMGWARILEVLRSDGSRPYAGTGLHIHVGCKTRRPDVDCERMKRFIHANTAKVMEITGRGYQGGMYDEGAIRPAYACTIELRIFKSTRDDREFWYRMEFCHALVSYCMDYSGTEWELFEAYVAENQGVYGALLGKLEEKEAVAA